MNILVINGSPNGENSATLKLTRAFLEGMGERAETVSTAELNAQPCRACYACWTKTGGKCVLRDGASEVLEKLRAAELVIWSVPLYCYSAPSHCKALMDRTLCFNRPQVYVGADGRAHHCGYEDGSKPTVLISSGGLPDVAGNFDGLVFQLRHMFGPDTAAILCAEAGLFLDPSAAPLTEAYLARVRQAGREYRAGGRIAPDTQAALDRPMLPRETYIENLNRIFSCGPCGQEG